MTTSARTAGVLLILLALLSVLVVPGLSTPALLDGTAGVVVDDRPPVVGDCLRDPPPTDGSRSLVFVPCTAPHAAEVVYRESLLPVAAAGTTPLSEFRSRCVDQQDNPWSPFLVEVSDGWQTEVDITVGVLSPDGRRLAAGQRWVACVAGPRSGTFDRPLATLRTGALPPEFGVCQFGDGTTEQYTTVVPCSSPHSSESFGFRRLAAGASLTQAALESGCRDLVAAATLRDDLPTESSLVVVADAFAWYAYGGTDGRVTLPLPAEAEGGYASCTVRTADGRQLISSLRRLGDAALPWAQ